jgi:acyl-CoA thioesterase
MSVKDFFNKDKFAKNIGIELLEAENGKAKAILKVEEKHFNGENITHGGAVFTLADFTLAAAANSHGKTAITLNASISFIKSSNEGTLTAEAFEISRKNKIGLYEVRISGKHEEIIAVAQGTFYIKQ